MRAELKLRDVSAHWRGKHMGWKCPTVSYSLWEYINLWNTVSLVFDFIVTVMLNYDKQMEQTKMGQNVQQYKHLANISFTKQHDPPACTPKWNVAFVQRSYSGASPVKTPQWGYEFSIWNKFYLFFLIRYGSKRCFSINTEGMFTGRELPVNIEAQRMSRLSHVRGGESHIKT